jgi:hypothetical protein
VRRLLAVLAGLAIAGSADAKPDRACDAAPAVLDGAKVVELAGNPDAIGLSLDAPGLVLREQDAVSWPACRVRLQARVYGGWAFTRSGVPVRPDRGRLVTRTDTIYPDDPEPAHPEVRGTTFISSANLAAFGSRLGVWRQADGSSTIATYRPGQPDAPHVLLRSAKPILGVGYLPAPDATGGMMLFWQDVGEGRYRFIMVSWDESGLRGEPKPADHSVPTFIPHHTMPTPH